MSASVQIDANECIVALEHNAEFFVQFFLGEEIHLPVPEFHQDIFSVMTHLEIDRFTCAIPRDHAKTTLAKLACVHYFIFTHYRFIVYLSNTTDIAIPSTNDIVSFLQCNNFVSIFGHCEWITKQEGKGVYKFKLPPSLGSKLCMLRALGAGKQVRGINIDNKRPQLAVVDDLEDNDNIATMELFMKLKRWVYGPFLKCLDKFDNKVIWLGNMISKNSMLFENCNSDYWYSRRYGCLLANGQPLWPDAWSIEKLQRDYREYQERGLADVWFAEMMNLPMAAGSGLIDAEDITYKPAVLPRDEPIGFLTVDLAISEEKWAHKTVIAVHSWVNDSFWQITYKIAYTGIDPIALFYEIIRIGQEWGYYAVGIESEAYQASLQFVFPHLCLVEQIEGFKFVPLKTGKTRKVERLAPWAGMLKSGDYALTEGDFEITQQLLEFDPSKKHNDDDTIDCCAYGPQMVREYYYEIWDSNTDDKEQLKQIAQSSYQIARI
jgi:hypothetical protein